MAQKSSVASPPSTARRSCSCSSGRVVMCVDIGQLLSLSRLVQQDVQCGKVGVPFDQRGHRAEAPEGRDIQLPDRRRNAAAVAVNQNVDAFGGVITGEMDLTDRGYRQGIEIANRIEPEISCAHINISDVAEDPAACSMADFDEEFRFGNRGMAIT